MVVLDSVDGSRELQHNIVGLSPFGHLSRTIFAAECHGEALDLLEL
jgi:hypothetical protein